MSCTLCLIICQLLFDPDLIRDFSYLFHVHFLFQVIEQSDQASSISHLDIIKIDNNVHFKYSSCYGFNIFNMCYVTYRLQKAEFLKS